MVYLWSIPDIYFLTYYMPSIYLVYSFWIVIYQEYILYIPYIFVSVIWFIPEGWCCGAGHGPIPPEPPAITSPGQVITVTFFQGAPLHRLEWHIWIRHAHRRRGYFAVRTKYIQIWLIRILQCQLNLFQQRTLCWQSSRQTVGCTMRRKQGMKPASGCHGQTFDVY